jgi:hypothetical protein
VTDDHAAIRALITDCALALDGGGIDSPEEQP